METSAKTIGEGLQSMFAAVVRRPIGWNVIDALARLEEREEEVRASVPDLAGPPLPLRQK
jgi:hypothetical protein